MLGATNVCAPAASRAVRGNCGPGTWPHAQQHGRAPSAGPSGGGHGLESVAEALGFIVSLVASAGDGALADLNVLGLALLARALAAGGGAFGRHEALLALLREDAWAALAAAARGGGLATLAGACQAALALYCTLGSAVLLQARAGGRGGPPICL